MDVITIFWNDENKYVEKIIQNNGDGYTSDTQYWHEYALDDYLWFYSENAMCKSAMNWSNEQPRTDMLQ